MYGGYNGYSVWITIISLLANAGLAFIPANMAKKKGRSFAGYWCLSFFVSFLVGIIAAACLSNKSEEDQIEAGMQKSTFSASYLGFVLMGAVLAFTLILASLSPYFFTGANLLNIMRQLVPYGLIAIAVALNIRAKGPDLSLGSVMAFSGLIAASVFSSGSSVEVSIVSALLVSILIGMVNGALTVYLKLPSVLTSVLIIIVLSVAGRVIGYPVIVQGFRELTQDLITLGFAVLLPLALLGGFLFVFLSRLGKPMNSRTSEENRNVAGFIAYTAGALLAGIAGVYMLSRIGSAMPVDNYSYIIYILFISGAVLSSRLLDNRAAPVFYAFGGAFLYSLINNVLNLASISTFFQLAVFIIIAAGFLAVGVFASRRAVRNMLTFK